MQKPSLLKALRGHGQGSPSVRWAMWSVSVCSLTRGCLPIFVTDTRVHIPSDSYRLWLNMKSLFLPDSRYLHTKPSVNSRTKVTPEPRGSPSSVKADEMQPGLPGRALHTSHKQNRLRTRGGRRRGLDAEALAVCRRTLWTAVTHAVCHSLMQRGVPSASFSAVFVKSWLPLGKLSTLCKSLS